MLVDMMALGVSAAFMHIVGSTERGRILMPLCVFPLLAVCDLFSVYNEVRRPGWEMFPGQ